MDIQISKDHVEPPLLAKLKHYVYPILGCCQEVHREMGPWLNEYMYQDALKIALEDAGIILRETVDITDLDCVGLCRMDGH